MTDGSAWRQPGHGAAPSPGGWATPTQGRPQVQPQPAPDSWWSDALADPWRDPDAPVVVVKTPQDEIPPLEKPPAPGPGPRLGLGLVLVVSIVTALLAGALGGTLGYVFAVGGGGGLGGTQLGSDPALNGRPPDSVAALAKKVLPSVVTISIRVGSGTSLGSGFVVSNDGHVITNNHVVEGGTGNATVRFSDATVVPAKVVGGDDESDVAVLKIDTSGLPEGKLVPVEFGDSDQVQVGDPVVAVGAPLGLTSTVTYGVVSYLDRPIRTSEGGTARYYAAIQTDAAVNQGNSGGPLFNAAGRVVGINSVIGTLSEDQSTAGNVGLAFAIPINHAKRIATDIINTGKARRTVMGVQPDPSYRNPAGGARLASVEANGPAASGGLKSGDVILAVNGKPIEEFWDLTALVRKYAPGDTVEIQYLRGTTREKTSVTLVADAK
ncbi:trypsin-like peptidase domain-containing protein [Dactylosporangium sp. AC04546]|uniref:trypsin-like peptidase domain-containing protein n=1 Tax=Dactylosporangium sp. AC04546 TaxID=2862460 RepID=UPI001EDF21AB|nr:trypsin-like peptidase domain-containing protein [Dactylosporangium sp. AC04546]WVK84609.1 trypsin-like peptidase domain-containing protein [Dactylosporangium sp. AC04546]